MIQFHTNFSDVPHVSLLVVVKSKEKSHHLLLGQFEILLTYGQEYNYQGVLLADLGHQNLTTVILFVTLVQIRCWHSGKHNEIHKNEHNEQSSHCFVLLQKRYMRVWEVIIRRKNIK